MAIASTIELATNGSPFRLTSGTEGGKKENLHISTHKMTSYKQSLDTALFWNYKENHFSDSFITFSNNYKTLGNVTKIFKLLWENFSSFIIKEFINILAN